MNDFCHISLSDLMTLREMIEASACHQGDQSASTTLGVRDVRPSDKSTFYHV